MPKPQGINDEYPKGPGAVPGAGNGCGRIDPARGGAEIGGGSKSTGNRAGYFRFSRKRISRRVSSRSRLCLPICNRKISPSRLRRPILRRNANSPAARRPETMKYSAADLGRKRAPAGSVPATQAKAPARLHPCHSGQGARRLHPCRSGQGARRVGAGSSGQGSRSGAGCQGEAARGIGSIRCRGPGEEAGARGQRHVRGPGSGPSRTGSLLEDVQRELRKKGLRM